ncbi:Kynurenine formamidase, bacterial (EC [Olavius algarvensis Delta 1 endosymbiont]|nr:Kynurenine formamidase, bacterial (EC [Olavius algarvensis Delta 1 endosymbiont]
MTKFIELSHIIENGMITYAGLPGPVIEDHLTREASRAHYAPGTTFQIGKIEMVANTGTYIDAPFHRYAAGRDLSQLAMASVADLAGLTIPVPEAVRAIKPEIFKGREVKDKAVLIHTGWSRHWGDERYFNGHPYLTRETAEYLKSAGALLVGIDSLNIDDRNDGTRPAHTLLLGAEIPIVEHLCNLEKLPRSGFKFFAVPAPVKGLGSFPVRAFAIVN